MSKQPNQVLKVTIVASGLIVLTAIAFHSGLLFSGMAVTCFALVTGRWSRILGAMFSRQEDTQALEPADLGDAETVTTVVEPQDMDEYVKLLLEQGRHALLLRPQIADNLRPEQTERAVRAMHVDMVAVPAGSVLLAKPNLDDDSDTSKESPGRLVEVASFFLDRYAVTNRQYKQFVDAGGYEDSGLWDPWAWSAILEFMDRSGKPGPRFWNGSTYPKALANHPVVGVSWGEAQAFARWTGKRLPSDPEWVKAGCWPVATSGPIPQQRKYPWGNSMDTDKANLWWSGIGSTVPVTDCPGGVSAGGVHQLVGNVWEWVNDEFGVWYNDAPPDAGQNPLKSLRGGAFDTYFENQAVCQFPSGDNPLARKHNIGFRCALSACDLTPKALIEPA